MRGELPKERLQEIRRALPKIHQNAHIITISGMGTAIDLLDICNDTSIGVSLVCLDDAIHRLMQVNNALQEAIACKLWYTEFTETEHKYILAITASKFYIDYAALLLYAIAEDISFFLIHFLNIENDIAEYINDNNNKRNLNKKKVSSNAAKVGIFLENKRPDEPLTKIILPISKNKDWNNVIKYRNTWVHDKPPIVEGLGIQNNRKSRILKSEDGSKIMEIGGGSPSSYTIDDLLEMVMKATQLITDTTNKILDHVKEYRERCGETFDTNNSSINFPLFSMKDDQISE